MQFGTDTYRRGAQERLEDARVLLERRRFVCSIYVAGLAVEGMLRSLIWLKDRKFDERHSLRDIAIRVRDLGLLRSGERDEDFVAHIQGVARCWSNDLRYSNADKAADFLFASGAIGRNDAEQLSLLSKEHFLHCSNVIKRCEVIWTRNRKSK